MVITGGWFVGRFTLKALARVATSVPVVTVRFLKPVGAVLAIVRFAERCVASAAAIPPAVIPVTKSIVLAAVKWVFCPTMAESCLEQGEFGTGCHGHIPHRHGRIRRDVDDGAQVRRVGHGHSSDCDARPGQVQYRRTLREMRVQPDNGYGEVLLAHLS